MGPTNRTPVRGAARLAAILDALPDALLLVDASGVIVNANAAALGLFEGESAQRLLGLQITYLLPGLGRTVATAGSAPAALPVGASGAPDPHATAGGAPVRRAPERMAARRTDGSVFPAEVTTAELGAEEDSELTLHVVRDLSGVLDVETELRRQQRQIELILRAASEGIIGVDHEGRIVLVNPAGAKILRYRAADLGGQNVHELLAHSRADGTPLPESESPLLDSVRTGAKHRGVDCVLWRSDGGPVYVDLTTAPVHEGENIIGAVMTFVDNSASRAAARQADELTEVIDRDLRGVLDETTARVRRLAGQQGTLGHGGTGHGGGYGGAAAELEELGADLERLSLLAADVVDFQRSVLGSLEYEPGFVELSDVVDAAVASSAAAANAAGVEITAHSAEVALELDPGLFVKLIAHLLADMVSVSPVGGKIVVTAARRGALARIEIRGPHTGGGPLHLPIAQAIATRHGGTVTTHRIAGKGNTHVVEVPVEQPAGAGRAKSEQDGGRHPVFGSRRAPQPAANPSSAANPEASTNSFAAPPPAAENVTENFSEALTESPAHNGSDLAQGHQRRRRAAATEVQTLIPAQLRSTLSRSVGSIEDLRPSKPMPTGDVWSKPDRSLTSDPAPTAMEQLSADPPSPPVEDTPPPQVSVSDTGEFAPSWQAGPDPAAAPGMSQASVTPAPRGRRRAAVAEADSAELIAPVPAAPEPPPESEPDPDPGRGPDQSPDQGPDQAGQDPDPNPEWPQLLLWPEPDEGTRDLLRARGYDPVDLGQPDRLPALIANGNGNGTPRPFAVFVDPIAAPITRRGLREVRAAATEAELPLLVTAGLGRSPAGAELGPDPSLLLTALTPPGMRLPRVLLVEARSDLADAIAGSLERQGMQVVHATTDAESRESAVAAPPDLVLLDLMQIRRRRVGVVDWLRDRGLLARTPLVVYTAEGSDEGGTESLYLTERAIDSEPAGRIGDLLAKIAP